MKLFGNSSGKNTPGGRKTPAPKKSPMDEDTRVIKRGEKSEEAPKARRTPEERARIDAMIEAYQKKKRKKRLIALGIIVGIVLVIFAAYKIIVRPPVVPTEPPATPPVSTPTPTPGTSATPTPTPTETQSAYTRKDGVYTFAILGVDNTIGLTDTIMVCRLDTVNKTMNLVNIPRDTLMNVERWYKRANGMMAHNGNNVDKMKADLKTILGFTVDFHVLIDMDAFTAFVEAIGGVDYNVPVNMDYDDIQWYRQDDYGNYLDKDGKITTDKNEYVYLDPPKTLFSVHLAAGYQHLDAEEALGVFRFRQNNDGTGYTGADISRIQTQQGLLKAVVKQSLKIENIAKIGEFVNIVNKYVKTDLSYGNLAWIAEQLVSFNSENVTFQTLPADYNAYVYGQAYCVINLDEWLAVINEKLSPYNEEITENALDVIAFDKGGNIVVTSGTNRVG